MSRALSRRSALRGSLTASLSLAAGVTPALAGPSPDAALIVAAEILKALRAREQQAWADLADDTPDDDPACDVASSLSAAVCADGEALAKIPALTPAGLATKASAMLALVGQGRGAEQEAFAEHHQLVVAVLRDAARIGGHPCATSAPAQQPSNQQVLHDA